MNDAPDHDNITRIIETNSGIAQVWKHAHGWAPDEAAALLSSAALDWQVDLSKSLRLWASDDIRRVHADAGDALLILAWANLGSLTEATMQWFLSVYLHDYEAEPDAPRHKFELLAPDDLMLERLRQFLDRVIWSDKPDFGRSVARIQSRRNGTHSFSRRDMGDWGVMREICL